MFFNLVTTRKRVEGKANTILQVLSPNVSIEKWQSWWWQWEGMVGGGRGGGKGPTWDVARARTHERALW